MKLVKFLVLAISMPSLLSAEELVKPHRLFGSQIGSFDRLCCTNRVRDSSREPSVVAGMYEQTHTPDLQDQELASLQ